MNDDQKNTKHTVPNFLELSYRQQEIVIYLYRFRFLTSFQLQSLLTQKWHSRTRVWLKNLCEKSYIEGKYNPSIKTGRMPTIYYLKNNGYRFIQTLCGSNSYLRKLQNEDLPRFSLLEYCLKTADIALLITSYYKKTQQTYRIYTKADIANTKDYHFIQPDLFIKSDSASSFFEQDAGTESPSTILKKLHNYLLHYQKFDWQIFSKDQYPCLIYVTTSSRRAKKLQNLFEGFLKQYDYPPITIKITTLAELKTAGLTEDICFTPFKGNERFLLV